jgi:hypothetical protein
VRIPGYDVGDCTLALAALLQVAGAPMDLGDARRALVRLAPGASPDARGGAVRHLWTHGGLIEDQATWTWRAGDLGAYDTRAWTFTAAAVLLEMALAARDGGEQ